MKKFLMKFGSCFAALALMMAAVGVNSTCWFHNYQPKTPESAKRLRRF